MQNATDSHVPHIALHCKRKAASDLGIRGIWIGVLQRAAGENGLLCVIKSYGAKLLPV